MAKSPGCGAESLREVLEDDSEPTGDSNSRRRSDDELAEELFGVLSRWVECIPHLERTVGLTLYLTATFHQLLSRRSQFHIRAQKHTLSLPPYHLRHHKSQERSANFTLPVTSRSLRHSAFDCHPYQTEQGSSLS